MPGQNQGIDMRSPEEREREREQLAPLVREALEAEDREPVRVVDKRGAARENTQQSAPVEAVTELSSEERDELKRHLAEQAAAADGEQKQEPGLRCAAFVVVSIDHNGQMHLHHQPEEMASIVQQGISAERPANAADLMNMANQLQVMVTGNEVSARVLEALNTQAQAQMARAAGMRPAGPVATGRRV